MEMLGTGGAVRACRSAAAETDPHLIPVSGRMPALLLSSGTIQPRARCTPGSPF